MGELVQGGHEELEENPQVGIRKEKKDDFHHMLRWLDALWSLRLISREDRLAILVQYF